jgi:hypothetical protein
MPPKPSPCTVTNCNICGGIPIEETDEVASPKATFNRAVDDAFEKAQAISNQRGGEYQDSWAIANQSTHFLNATLRLIDTTEGYPNPTLISKEAKRLIMLASMCDVKISRMLGPYKADTFEDLLNYLAAFMSLSTEYIEQYA